MKCTAFYILLLLWHVFNVNDATLQLSLALQNICANTIPSHTHRPFTAAMVCGTHVRGNIHTEVFRNSGLLHILVVSGAHLHFFAIFLRRFQMKRKPIFLLLFIYVLFSGCQPPSVRSLIQIGIEFYSKSFERNLRSWQCVWIAGLASLILFPEWLTGSSLLLSWICALILTITGNHHQRSSILIFCALIPILMKWLPPHPLTILINILISPVFGVFALPLCLLCTVIPQLTVVADAFWSLLLTVLLPVQPYLTSVNPAQSSHLLIWMCLLITHILWERYYVSNQRKNSWKKSLPRALAHHNLKTP